MKYRISEGVLLRSKDKHEINLSAFVGGKWKVYPDILKDWDTNSSPASQEEVQRILGGKHD